uniref:Zinc finger protein 26 n=1 Tax=Cacopsylla melanoneura TaxID=428564 RepID=A0A8D8Q0K3_9HEMI
MIIKIPRDKVEIFEMVSIKQEFDEICSSDVLCDVKPTSNLVATNLIENETEVRNMSNKASYNQCEGPSGLVTKSNEDQKFWCNVCAAEFQYEKHLVLHVSREHVRNQVNAENEDTLGLDKDIFDTVTIKKEFDESCSSASNTSKPILNNIYNIQGHGLSINVHNQIQSTSKSHEEESLQCDMCSENFSSKKILIKHLTKKHKSKRSYTKYKKASPKNFECLVCHRNFEKSFRILNHTRKCHPSYNCFMCLFCEKLFPSVTKLTKHSKTIHSQSTHACVTCWKVYTSPKCLKTHLKVCQTPLLSKIQVNCEVCGKILQTQSIENHLRVHMGIVFPCTECSETFLHFKTLCRHRNVKHRGIFLKCNLCAQIYSDDSDLKRHVARHKIKSSTEKGNSQLYSCDLCGKKFVSKSHMSDHIRSIHLNEYCCKICSVSRSYNSIYYLKRHIEEQHEGKKKKSVYNSYNRVVNYYCNLCNKKRNEKRQLLNHLNRTHYNIKLPKVICEVCGLACANQRSLQRHKERHGKERLSCHLCEKSYAIRFELLAHIRMAHLRINCSKCNLKFKSNKKFMQHIQLECPGRYVCYYCNMIFDNKQKVKCHIQGYHFLQVNVRVFHHVS